MQSRLKTKNIKKNVCNEYSTDKFKFDDFVRGWIGTGKEYKYGVIHFAPSVSSENVSMFDKTFDTLLMFRQNGQIKTRLSGTLAEFGSNHY